jgi:hypothetical protein
VETFVVVRCIQHRHPPCQVERFLRQNRSFSSPRYILSSFPGSIYQTVVCLSQILDWTCI